MRNINLDIIRCIAIIFVICIHSMGKLNESINISIIDINYCMYIFLSSIIYMGVPLFVMLSGALLLGKNEEPHFFLKKRFKRILIPFFIWSMIVFSLDKIINDQSFYDIQSISEFFIKFLTNGVHGIYWYIYMLIGLYLLTPIIQKVFDHISLELCNYFIILIILFITIQYITPQIYEEKSLLFKYSFPYLIYLGYYIGGYYLYTYAIKFKNFQKIATYSFIIFYLIGIINTIKPFTTIPFQFYQSLFFFGMLLCIKLKSLNSNKQAIIVFISNTSYGIYLSHFLFISILCKTGIEQTIPAYLVPILITLIVVCLEIGLQFSIKYLKLEKLLQ